MRHGRSRHVQPVEGREGRQRRPVRSHTDLLDGDTLGYSPRRGPSPGGMGPEAIRHVQTLGGKRQPDCLQDPPGKCRSSSRLPSGLPRPVGYKELRNATTNCRSLPHILPQGTHRTDTVQPSSLLEASIGPMLDPEMLFNINFYDSNVIYRLSRCY